MLNELIEEKGFDLEGTVLEVEGPEWGTNFIPLGSIVEYILSSGIANQKKVRDTFVKIDFMNGDILHFFTHIAKHMAH